MDVLWHNAGQWCWHLQYCFPSWDSPGHLVCSVLMKTQWSLLGCLLYSIHFRYILSITNALYSARYSMLYRIAGNFRWCKISRNCKLTLQKKFNFRTFSTSRPHPPPSIACMTSRFLHPFKILCFLFSRHPIYPQKTWNFCTMRKFPTIYGIQCS
jgi:hypothetical protein